MHKNRVISGKNIVQIADALLLDNFSKLWYNGSLGLSTCARPGHIAPYYGKRTH